MTLRRLLEETEQIPGHGPPRQTFSPLGVRLEGLEPAKLLLDVGIPPCSEARLALFR